jgi:hypothetical protein
MSTEARTEGLIHDRHNEMAAALSTACLNIVQQNSRFSLQTSASAGTFQCCQGQEGGVQLAPLVVPQRLLPGEGPLQAPHQLRHVIGGPGFAS